MTYLLAFVAGLLVAGMILVAWLTADEGDWEPWERRRW